MPIRRVLIANRGEIAVRIIRTLRELGITSIAVFSEPDRTSLHVLLADEAYPLGPGPSGESYLNLERVLETARRTRADAVHPGYGFFAENAAFARACTAAGLVFIGPAAATIEALGDKLGARDAARAAGVPVIPGADAALADLDEARTAAERTATGGTIALKAEGDVILRDGSALDVSGGGIRYPAFLRQIDLRRHPARRVIPVPRHRLRLGFRHPHHRGRGRDTNQCDTSAR